VQITWKRSEFLAIEDVMTEHRPAHILVVEDDRDIRDSVVEILEDEGYTVSDAAGGQEALERLASGSTKPNLILLDLMMPGMNGFQFRQKQLESVEFGGIPVIVITADSTAQDRSGPLKAAAFLRKPIKIQPLLNTIKQTLERTEGRSTHP
jgi:CheY-like chemotaxis protein